MVRRGVRILSSKTILFLRIFLLIILGLSIFHLWNLRGKYLDHNSSRVFADIKQQDLAGKFEKGASNSYKGEVYYKSDLLKDFRGQNWEGIVRNLSFNLKKEKPVTRPISQDHPFPPIPAENNNKKIDEAVKNGVQKKKEIKPERVIPPPSFVLLAVSDKGENSRAILGDKFNGQTYIIRPKEKIGEYLVRKIVRDSVILSREKQEFILDFSSK